MTSATVPQQGRHTRRRRYAFTLLEVLLASGFTAAACTAGTLLIQSISDVSATSAGLYEGVAAARNGLACMDLWIGQARLLGYRDNTQILLWRNDDDRNGRISSAELVLLRYNATAGILEEVEIYFPPGTSSTVINQTCTTIGTDAFISTNPSVLLGQSSYVRTRALVTGVSQLRFRLDANTTSAAMVVVDFTVTRKDGAQAFHAVMTPRSPMWNLMQ